jgi:hypothetical protein
VNQLQGIKSSTQNYLKVWKSIDLVETLIELSDSPYYNQIRQIFDIPMRYVPEYLLLTITKTKPKAGNLMMDDLYTSLLPNFLLNHMNSIPVLNEVWNANKSLVINGMAQLYRRNPKNMNLSRILDISQMIKNSLMKILTESKDYYFVLQLGMLGAKRDFLHFENWIVMLIKEDGNNFVRALLKYIDKFLIKPSKDAKEDQKKITTILERSQLSEEKLCMIYENLHQISESKPDLLDHATK